MHINRVTAEHTGRPFPVYEKLVDSLLTTHDASSSVPTERWPHGAIRLSRMGRTTTSRHCAQWGA
jgi:hypothetical protein